MANFLDQWIEIQRHRPLHPHEQARLQACLDADPALRARWEQEQALTRLLRELPDAPVPSNFNERVWAAAQRATMPSRHSGHWPVWLRLPHPAVWSATAVCVLTLVLGGFGYARYQAFHRAQMAALLVDVFRGVEIAAVDAEIPPEQILQDFEAIYRLGQVRSLADEELLAALQ